MTSPAEVRSLHSPPIIDTAVDLTHPARCVILGDSERTGTCSFMERWQSGNASDC